MTGPKRHFWSRKERLMRRDTGLYVPPGNQGKAPVHPCQIVVTAKSGTNGKVLRVRCRCMSQVKDPSKFFTYDYLAEGEMSLQEAVKVWEEHRETKS